MKPHTPLAEKVRPKKLDEIVGQEHLLSPDSLLPRSIASKKPLSLLLWGPPGCGKTTLANIYAKAFEMRFVKISAIFSGVADLKKLVHEQQSTPLFGQGVLLFVDEIHRFNKAQQDAFLPFLEDGTITLIGATTENPSFYLNNALLSRMRVLKLQTLDETALAKLLERYEASHGSLPLTDEARTLLIRQAQGDGRYLYNLIENVQTHAPSHELSAEELAHLLQKRPALFDRGADGHYNLISALHKAVRGSDPDASLYWLSRILAGGEDPRFLARRMIRMASEDIGLADPEALTVTLNAQKAYETLGSPEGELALAQAAVYLALAPKSNALYTAFKASMSSAEETSQLDPPPIILNAPTKLMKQMGYGKGYIYDHDTPEGYSGQNYFPDGLEPERYYHPKERGFEREMCKRMHYFSKLKAEKHSRGEESKRDEDHG